METSSHSVAVQISICRAVLEILLDYLTPPRESAASGEHGTCHLDFDDQNVAAVTHYAHVYDDFCLG